MQNIKLGHLLLLLAVAVAVSGCQSAPPLSFSVPNVGIAQRKINAELKSITVNTARPDEQKGELVVGVGMKELWQTSLTEALNTMAIFQDDGPKKLNLAVKILKVDVPRAGISMTTEAIARYEITDRKTGDIIYTQDISSSGATPGDYAFSGLIRIRESINRAVQNNISLFLQALETVNVERPMFPVGQGAK